MLSAIENMPTADAANKAAATVTPAPAAAAPTNPHDTWGVLAEEHAKLAGAKHLRTTHLFGAGVGKVLKQVHPGKELTRAAASTMDDLLASVLMRMVETAARLSTAMHASAVTNLDGDYGDYRHGDYAVAVLEARSAVGARPGAAEAELLVSGNEEGFLQWVTRDALRTEPTGKGAAALAAWDAADAAARAAAPAAYAATLDEECARFHKGYWEQAHGRTLDSRDVQTAMRLVVPGELAKHAVSEGTKAVTKLCSSDPRRGVEDSLSTCAGLQFSVAVTGELMARLSGKAIGDGAACYMAATLEYLSAECLELSGNAARDNDSSAIGLQHLQLAIGKDEELNTVFPGFGASRVAAAKSGPWEFGGARAVAEGETEAGGAATREAQTAAVLAELVQLAKEHVAAVEAKDHGRCAAIDKEVAERQRQMMAEVAAASATTEAMASDCHYTAGSGVLRIADGGGGDANCFGSGGDEAEDLAAVLGKTYDPALSEEDYDAEEDYVRDNIQGVGDGMVRRLAVRAGVPAVHPAVYEETRSAIKAKLESLVREAVTFCDHRRRRACLVLPADTALALASQAAPSDASLAGSGVAVALLLVRSRTTLADHRIAARVGPHDAVVDADADRDWSAAVAAVCAARAELSGDDDDDADDAGGAASVDKLNADGGDDDEGKEGEADDARTAAHRAHVRDFRAHAPIACEQRALPFRPFTRLVFEVGQYFKTDVEWDARAIAMLGAAVESHVVHAFQRAAAYAAGDDADAAKHVKTKALCAPGVARAFRELNRVES